MSDSSQRFVRRIVVVVLSLNAASVYSAVIASAAVASERYPTGSAMSERYPGSVNSTAVNNNQTTNANEATLVQVPNTVVPLDYYKYRIKNMFEYLEGRPDEECPKTGNSDVYRFYCPTPQYNNANEWICIKIDDLCNNIPDCPGAEDEDPTHCMYYLAIQQQTHNIRHTIFKLFRRQLEEMEGK